MPLSSSPFPSHPQPPPSLGWKGSFCLVLASPTSQESLPELSPNCVVCGKCAISSPSGHLFPGLLSYAHSPHTHRSFRCLARGRLHNHWASQCRECWGKVTSPVLCCWHLDFYRGIPFLCVQGRGGHCSFWSWWENTFRLFFKNSVQCLLFS